jgi:3-dehydroquinate synthase
VVRGLDEFRIHLGGELTLTLLEGIGQGVEVHELSRRVVAKAITQLEQRHARLQSIRRDSEHPAD